MTPCDTPVRRIPAEVNAGRSSCVEAVARSLDAIAGGDGAIRAFVSVQRERALERARALDDLGAGAKSALPLLGVPVAIKDNICTAGVATTCSSRMLRDFVPPYDAAVVEALEAAGAVVVGKTNLDEFAMGSSTETSAVGPTRNPVDADRIPGGSSGGSAAAVAAGFVPASLGSDTGGSIRQPCSHCGVAGLKPTYGRVSRYGLVAFASSLDQVGPIAADVRDLGLLLSVLSRPDPRDSTNARAPFADSPELYTTDLSGLRVGLPKEYYGAGLSREVSDAIETLKGRLASAGAVLTDVSLPTMDLAVAAYYVICTAEASSNLARYDGVKYGFRAARAGSIDGMYCATRSEGFGAEVKRRIMLGTYVLSSGYYDAYYLKAARVRTLIARDFRQAFGSCDVLLSPVAPTPAFRLGEKSSDPLQMYLSDIYTVSANLAGIPAVSVPCGRAGGLPVGAQFMADAWREDVLLRTAYAAQELSRG